MDSVVGSYPTPSHPPADVVKSPDSEPHVRSFINPSPERTALLHGSALSEYQKK